MTRRRARTLQATTRLVLGWVVASSAVGWALATDQQPSSPPLSVALGLAMGLVSAWFELDALPRYARRWTAAVVIGARTVFYAAAAAFFIVALVGWAGRNQLGLELREVYRHPGVQSFLESRTFLGALVLLTTASFAINFIRQVRLMLGPSTLGALLVGRYRVPVREERAFLFLDLTGSTALAQRLGPRRFNDFKNDFFRDVVEPILATGGQIYQYVGDEVVITWRVRGGRLPVHPVETFFLLDAALARRSSSYQRRYGAVPTYKAGLHCGTVATAEVGELKKDIVHSGDVVNVTARIEGQCHALSARLLASDAALALAPLPDGVRAEAVGEIRLRGREGAVPLFRVSDLRPPAEPARKAGSKP